MVHASGVLYQAHLTLRGRSPFPVPFLPSTAGLARRCWHLEIDLTRHCCRSWQKGGPRGVGALSRHRDSSGGGAETAGKPQPFNPCRNPPERAGSHPAPSSRSPRLPANNSSQTRRHAAAKQGRTLLDTSRGITAELSLPSAELGNTCHRPDVQYHTTKPGAAFLFL